MSDLFGGNDRMAELEARVEALEALLMPQAQRQHVKAEEPLNEAWQLWNRHRNGKGWTALAKKLSMNKLRELAGTDGALALAIVNQSVEAGYSSLYPLKSSDNTRRGSAAAGSAPSAVQTKTVAQALAPSETKEQRDAAHKAHLRRLGIREE